MVVNNMDVVSESIIKIQVTKDRTLIFDISEGSDEALQVARILKELMIDVFNNLELPIIDGCELN